MNPKVFIPAKWTQSFQLLLEWHGSKTPRPLGLAISGLLALYLPVLKIVLKMWLLIHSGEVKIYLNLNFIIINGVLGAVLLFL